MRKYRTLREFLNEQLASQDEAIGFLQFVLEEYQVEGDTSFFLRGIQNVIEAQGGVTEIAKQIHMAPDTLSKILSSKEAPQIDTLETILNALGCKLSITPLRDDNTAPDLELSAEESTQLKNAQTQLSESDSP